MFWFGILLWLASIAGVIAITNSKGRPDAGAVLAIVAMFIGPFALLPAVILSRDDEHLRRRKIWTTHKVCPVCAELVRREAIKCRYCGAAFDVAPASEVRAPTPRQLRQLSAEELARRDRLSRRLVVAIAVVIGALLLKYAVVWLWDFAGLIANRHGYRLIPPSEWFGL